MNEEKIENYIKLLFKYNKMVNLMSRKLVYSDVKDIINETLLFNNYIDYNIIIDAGSGNGIIGIPLAIINNEKKIILVETRKKKKIYLKKIFDDLEFKNVTKFEGGIKNYFNVNIKIKKRSLISRGFPNNYDLIKLMHDGFVKQVVLITIEDKIKKTKFAIDNIEKNVYNIVSKDLLKIIKLEKVSRETKKKE